MRKSITSPDMDQYLQLKKKYEDQVKKSKVGNLLVAIRVNTPAHVQSVVQRDLKVVLVKIMVIMVMMIRVRKTNKQVVRKIMVTITLSLSATIS